jgi:hypothetical protein
MVRSVEKDFETLVSFLSKYSLKELAALDAGRACAKKGHKVYLSFLTLWAECLLSANQGKLRITDKLVVADSRELLHFRECVADVGGSFFCCLNGAYKPAYMSLRSSIENFLRFICSSFDLI